MSVKILQEEYEAYLRECENSSKDELTRLVALRDTYEKAVQQEVGTGDLKERNYRRYASNLLLGMGTLFQAQQERLKAIAIIFDDVLPGAQIAPLRMENSLCDIPRSLRKEAEKYDKWLYQNVVYGVSGLYSDDKKKLLILDFADKERQKFERLATKFSVEQTEHVKHERTRIPENVRIEVWRRDQGKCAGCGSCEKLEYDHIVPISRGGSNTARNVELLCEVCNRSKGDRIQ